MIDKKSQKNHIFVRKSFCYASVVHVREFNASWIKRFFFLVLYKQMKTNAYGESWMYGVCFFDNVVLSLTISSFFFTSFTFTLFVICYAYTNTNIHTEIAWAKPCVANIYANYIELKALTTHKLRDTQTHTCGYALYMDNTTRNRRTLE